MKKLLLFAVLVAASFSLAQAGKSDQTPSNNKNGQVTVRGCVSREAGDYILMKDDPGNSYELQATGKIKLHSYLGQRVEVRGTKSPTMATSSDQGDREGAATSVTITVSSIKTLSKECVAR